jgi:hypothetical protein
MSFYNVIGGGFSGFWFHLGFFHSIPNLGDYDFYCFSSGCLSKCSHSFWIGPSVVAIRLSYLTMYSQNAGLKTPMLLIGILLAFTDRTVDEVLDAGFLSQELMLAGNLTRFDVVERFVDEMLSKSSTPLDEFLPRLKILVTTVSEGYQIANPSNYDELKDAIVKTTWV